MLNKRLNEVAEIVEIDLNTIHFTISLMEYGSRTSYVPETKLCKLGALRRLGKQKLKNSPILLISGHLPI